MEEIENKPTYHRIASIIYNLFIRTYGMDARYKHFSPYWQDYWKKSLDCFRGPVKTKIHGFSVILKYGATYPLMVRRYPDFNNPIIELTYQCYQVHKRPIYLVDIGSAVGDTILLLHANCPGMIEKFYCIDGDLEFFRYLRYNLRNIKNGELVFQMLSSSEGDEKELLHIHRGTASAQGNHKVKTTTLDKILMKKNPERVDLLKIDVDGFDGRVLMGSKKTIERYLPAIIFEWHPFLCQKTSNNWIDHFETLSSLGYSHFIWFTKLGQFSHIMKGFDRSSVDIMAEFCLKSKVFDDWHYDVIALHPAGEISPFAVADANHARSCKFKI